MTGKGSKRRPEDAKRIADNWELAFGKKDKKPVKYVPVRKLKEGTSSAHSAKQG